jgi:cytochrome c oxidase cbb3-type subunit I/II
MDNQKHTDSEKAYGQFHRRMLEGKATVFAIVTTVAISIGALVELIPMFTATSSLSWERGDWITPYTPLEVAGRDIYVREGCYLCHSQMIRPMRAEILRYGEWTRAAEYQYDRPFLLGSRRMGPDLQRVGQKYPDAWHYEHMRDPRTTSPGSMMPNYGWLHEAKVDPSDVTKSVVALSKVGTPYAATDEASVQGSLEAQGQVIVGNLASAGITAEWDDEIVAMIAYLQRLGVEGRAYLADQGGGQ